MYKDRTFPAAVNRCLVKLQKSEWRGKHKFYLFMAKYFPKKVIVHDVGNRRFSVPVGEWCFWLEKGPENYYLEEFVPFCNSIKRIGQDFTLFDLGADIGTVSSLVASYCNNLHNIIAFEPNPKAFELLQSNLAQIGPLNTCVNNAISNFEGRVALCADSTRINDHEGYIDRNKVGDTVVTSIDRWVEHSSIELKPCVVVKIDVEGQEIQALEGAVEVLKSAQIVILLVEVHPDVLTRTGFVAEDLFIAAEQIRPFEWSIPLCDNLAIDRNLPLFRQVPTGQYDVIGISWN